MCKQKQQVMKNTELLDQLEISFREQIKELEEKIEELKNNKFSSSLQSDYQSRIIQAYYFLLEVQTLNLKHR